MIRNYLTVALRNLRRQFGYTLLNMVGLAVGIACCVLIALFIRDELSYDRAHPDVDRLYRIKNIMSTSGDMVPAAITPAIYSKSFHEKYPDVLDFARFHSAGIGMMFAHGEERSYESGVVFADSSFLRMFHFPLAAGDAQTALVEPYSAVLTPDIARKYFGDGNVLGQRIRVNESFDVTVTGVLAEDQPHSHFRFNMLLSYKTIEMLNGQWFYGASGLFLNSWHLAAGYSYVKLAPGADIPALEAGLNELVKTNVADDGPKYELSLFPVSDIHLKSDMVYEMGGGGSIWHIWVFGIVSAFIILIACINYMNLATARAVRRSAEVGLRKVMGAHREQLVRQFLAESVLITLMVLVVALLLVAAALPLFNTLTEKELSVAAVFEWDLLLTIVGATLLTGLASGMYPAFYLARFEPSQILKGASTSGTGGRGGLRKALVVFQFAVSVVLIVGTVVVYQQLRYFQNKDVGYAKEQLLVVSMRDPSLVSRAETFKQRLRSIPGVMSVAASSSVPGLGVGRHDTKPEGRPADERWLLSFYGVDFDFVETMGFEMAEGRAFSPEFSTDSTQAYLINESAAERLGWSGEAVGKEFTWYNPRKGALKGQVVGVVKNFHYAPLSQPIEPAFFALDPTWAQSLAVRVQSDDLSATMAAMESAWKELAPAFPFEYQFQDERLGRVYRSEEQFGRLFGSFAVLAIFIACLGLFGLAAYAAEQRRKEIGIRKVFGASSAQILGLLSYDFLKLVAVGFVVAVPVSWWVMDRWLDDFAYRVTIGAGVFLAAGLLTLAIAIATVSVQSLRAANANPVKSLRSE